ncbi:MAG: hypothetical protein K2O34_10420 [Acetatifactor sp.]|nr:hypothetical protein [Acetatifactor sp.]
MGEKKCQGILSIGPRSRSGNLCHQEPFNCCSKTAASGSEGSVICKRPIPQEKIPDLLFGPSKAKQKPLKLNAKGQLTTLSLSGAARKMSKETEEYFDSLFN